MDGLLALDLWDLVIEVLGTTHRIPKRTQACTRENLQRFSQKAVSRVMSGTICCIFLTSWTTPHFPAATFPIAIFFFPQEKQSEMSKRPQESSSLGSPMAKAEASCLVSREGVSVGQNYSSNPGSPGSTRNSLVWTWEERNTKSGWYSVQHASGNRKYSSEDSGGLAETHASGNREHTRKVVQNIKDHLRRWKHLGNIDQLREDACFDMDKIYGFIDAGSIAHGPELRKELGNIQEFWIWEHPRFVGNYEWWFKGIQKLRMYFPQTLRAHFGKTRIAERTSNKVDESKSFHLLGLRVMLWKTARSRRCNKKVEWSSVNFEDVSCLQRIVRVGWRADWLRVEDLPRSHSIGHSPRNSSRPTRKAHYTWKLQ